MTCSEYVINGLYNADNCFEKQTVFIIKKTLEKWKKNKKRKNVIIIKM